MSPRLHRLAEARSLALHREVVRRLRAEPQRIQEVKERVARWRQTGEVARYYADAWWDLLQGPEERLFETMQSEDERATALRQASPFLRIVDPRTRWRLWRETSRGSER